MPYLREHAEMPPRIPTVRWRDSPKIGKNHSAFGPVEKFDQAMCARWPVRLGSPFRCAASAFPNRTRNNAHRNAAEMSTARAKAGASANAARKDVQEVSMHFRSRLTLLSSLPIALV